MSRQNEEAKPASGLRKLLPLGLLLLLLLGVVLALPRIGDLLTLVVISLVISYVFRPLVRFFENHHYPVVPVILVLFSLVGGLLALIGFVLLPSLTQQLESILEGLKQIELEKHQEALISLVESYFPNLGHELRTDFNPANSIVDQIRSLIGQLLNQTLSVLAGALNIATLLSVLPIFVFFILKDGDRWVRNALERVPNSFFEMTVSILYRIDQQIGSYIVMVVVSSLFVGFTTWASFELIGIRYSVALGVIGALLNVIPFFGPLLTVIPTALVVLMTYEPVGLGLLYILVILLIIQQTESFLVKPALLSHSMSVHPAVVIFVVLVGARLGGALGMFIAVPVYAILKLIVVDLYDHMRNYKLL